MQPALPTPRRFARASTIPAPVIALALQAHFRSRQQFGGHAVKQAAK
ncbi:MAG TPA: hypothetical protein VN610_03570 [Bryobacteraceae bacterium]|nr:hypothetical protein [Bryobacteraceae bacterium]